jgi:hypothetical protein
MSRARRRAWIIGGEDQSELDEEEVVLEEELDPVPELDPESDEARESVR